MLFLRVGAHVIDATCTQQQQSITMRHQCVCCNIDATRTHSRASGLELASRHTSKQPATSFRCETHTYDHQYHPQIARPRATLNISNQVHKFGLPDA